MAKAVKFGIIGLIALAIAIGIWRWGMVSVSRRLSSMPVEQGETAALGAMGDLVLDESVLKTQEVSKGGGVLEEYSKNSSSYDERAKLVLTWTRATSLIRAVSQQIPIETPINTSTLIQVSPDQRVDAWDNPFCVYSTNTNIAVLSSGGSKLSQCDSLRQIATRLTKTVATKKLVKDKTGFYAVVLPIPPHT